MNIFRTLTAGDSASWHDDPVTMGGIRFASGIWTLTYQLRGPSQITVTAQPDGDGWLSKVLPGESAALVAGLYQWGAYMSRADERITIAGGTLTVKADLAAIDGAIDARSVAVRALADCETALANFKSSNGKVKSYTIGTRQTEFHSLTELMQLRDLWQRKVNSEAGNQRRLYVRF